MTMRTVTVGALAVNCYIVYDETKQAAVVDPGDEAERLLAELTRLGLTVKAILLTHAHFDHIGAAERLAAETGAPLYIHEAEQAALTDASRNLSAYFGEALCVRGDVRTLRDGDEVTVGTMTCRTLHTPGHTVGGASFLIGNTLFSGDTLFCESIGRLDFPGGSSAAMRRSLERLMTLPADTAVYPGHGEPTTVGHEQQYNPYM